MATRKRSTSLQGIQDAISPPLNDQRGSLGTFVGSSEGGGTDMRLVNPQWAKWFDMVRGAGVGAFGGTSKAGNFLSQRQQYVDQHSNQLANPSNRLR